jgi:lipoprotein-releasing system permease protein
MPLPLLIAKRYLFAIKKVSFISIISWLSLVGIAFGTAALIVVLSVFNGLEDLNRSLFKTYDAALTILPKSGKTFDVKGLDIQQIKAINKVLFVNKTLQDNALLRHNGLQCVATIKGVDTPFLQNTDFQKSIIEGKFALPQNAEHYGAVLGVGLQQKLLVSTENFFEPVEFWYPSTHANLINITEASFVKERAMPMGVFSIEQAYDNTAIVPLALAQSLFSKTNKISSIEVHTAQADVPEVKQILKQKLPAFKVLDTNEMHASLLRAIKIEKLFVYLALVLITGVAALNLFFSLTMLVIEKQKDIATLRSIGASSELVRNIFRNTGFIILLVGLVLGLLLGFVLCFLQQKYGMVKMGMDSALVDAYPVRITLTDFLATALGVFLLGLIIIQFPARKASIY